MHFRRAILFLLASTPLLLNGCADGGGGGSPRSSSEVLTIFSGGLLFHSAQVPSLYAMQMVADVHGGDGVDDLIMVAREQGPGGFGEGTFLAPGLDGGGFGELLELRGDALDLPAVADFNRDGLLDMVLGRFEIEIYFGNAGGSFDVVTIDELGATAAHMATPLAADFDLDNDPDFAITRDDETLPIPLAVVVYLNQGNGTFAAVPTALTGQATLVGPPADYNGDILPDLGVLVDRTQLLIFFGRGDGSFDPPATLLGGTAIATSVTADINVDGLPDVVSLESSFTFPPTELQFVSHINQGAGLFDEVRSVFPAAGWDYTGLLIDDLTGDDLPDAVFHPNLLASGLGSYLAVGAGDGTFIPPATQLQTGNILNSITGDFNNDGVKDLYNRALIEGLPGGGFYRDPVFDAVVYAAWSAAADIYQDGVGDVLVGDTNEFQILIPNGDGTFTQSVPIDIPEWPVLNPFVGPTPRVGDLDGDDLPDLLLFSPSAPFGQQFPPAQWLSCLIREYTTVEFMPFLEINIPLSLMSDLTDLNGDGTLDFTARESQSITDFRGRLWAFFGDGGGTFGEPVPVTTELASNVPIAADLNGDGRRSLLVVIVGASGHNVYHVSASGEVTFSETLPIDGAVVVGRLDSDARDDLVSVSSSTLSIYYGNSADSVDAGQTIDLGSTIRNASVSILDLGGDGVAYIVVNSTIRDELVSPGVTHILRRTASRQFTLLPVVRSQVGVQPNSILDDFTLDGQPDIVTMLGNTLQVLQGLGGGAFNSPAYFDVDPLAMAMFHGDYDSDGDLDIAAIRPDEPTMTIKMNRLIP